MWASRDVSIDVPGPSSIEQAWRWIHEADLRRIKSFQEAYQRRVSYEAKIAKYGVEATREADAFLDSLTNGLFMRP